MHRTVTLKLVGPTHLLDQPMRDFTAACDTLSRHVETGECRPNARQLQATYHQEIRAKHGLMSQAAISATRCVQAAYKTIATLGHNTHPKFTSPMLVLLHRREWRFKDEKLVLSLPGVKGGMGFSVQMRPVDAERLRAGKPGAGTLVRRGAHYFLKVSIELPDVTPIEPTSWIGVDGGLRNTAVTIAPGERAILFSGGALREYRRKQRRTRQRLQKKGTRSARRVLTRLSRREQRHVLDQCRVIAKRIVTQALAEHRGIKLEDLQGIRNGVWVRKNQRADRHSWAFRLLQTCIKQKAEECGVPVLFVNPAFTSRTCPKCVDARKSNRKGDAFRCLQCGYVNHADVVGATNISRCLAPGRNSSVSGGRVNGPNGHTMTGKHGHRTGASSETESKPPTSVGGS